MAKKKGILGNVHPAVIAVWAALIASSHLLPSIPLVGVGGTLSVATCLCPIAGVFFGPLAGGLCTAIGSFIGDLIQPSGAWLGTFTFLVPTSDAIIAGLCSRGKKTSIAAVLVAVVGWIVWMATDIGRKAWMFGSVVAGIGAVAALICFFVGKKFLLKKNPALIAISFFCCSLAGMLGAAILADCASVLMFKTPAITWKVLTPVTPVERSIFSAASTIIGVPLLAGLPKIGIFVGPTDPNEVDEDISVD